MSNPPSSGEPTLQSFLNINEFAPGLPIDPVEPAGPVAPVAPPPPPITSRPW